MTDRLECSQSAFAELRPVLRLRNDTLRSVQRTNNPAEHFFCQAKREMRSRLGRAHLGRDM